MVGSPREREYDRVVEATTWSELVFRQVAARGDAEALVFADRRVTYGAFAERVVDRACSLLAAGVKPGSHVGILMPSSIDYLECFFAASAIGCVAVLINSRYRVHELAYVIENADIELLITTGRVTDEVDFAARLSETFPDLVGQADPDDLNLATAPLLRRIVLFGDSRPGFIDQRVFEEAGQSVNPGTVHRLRHETRLRDPFLMMYTSGTTSMPKGCLLSHEAVVRTVQNVAFRYQLTEEDRFWSPLPLFHMGGLNPLGAALWAGSTFIGSANFEPGEALATLEHERVSVAFLGFPAIINGLATHPNVGKHDFSRLRAMSSSVASYPAPVRDRLIAAFPHVTQTGMYGMTESAGACTTTAVYDGREAGLRAVGRPMPGIRFRIVREDGTEAEPGEAGEIQFAGYALFSGYYKAPEKTTEVLQTGWMRSGDLGSINDHGEIVFKSRIKDMLKVGGENVASAEIEEFLHGHPAVKLCQVVGVPDERLGEVAAAFVELREGLGADEAELIAFCKGRIAGFKVPRFVRFVSEWPLTASSKVKKTELTKRLAEELSAVPETPSIAAGEVAPSQ